LCARHGNWQAATRLDLLAPPLACSCNAWGRAPLLPRNIEVGEYFIRSCGVIEETRSIRLHWVAKSVPSSGNILFLSHTKRRKISGEYLLDLQLCTVGQNQTNQSNGEIEFWDSRSNATSLSCFSFLYLCGRNVLHAHVIQS
jgi:hypothetical protein